MNVINNPILSCCSVVHIKTGAITLLRTFQFFEQERKIVADIFQYVIREIRAGDARKQYGFEYSHIFIEFLRHLALQCIQNKN